MQLDRERACHGVGVYQSPVLSTRLLSTRFLISQLWQKAAAPVRSGLWAMRD
jgi:hypothetical protein